MRKNLEPGPPGLLPHPPPLRPGPGYDVPLEPPLVGPEHLDMKETSTACSTTEQKPLGLFAAGLGIGKTEFTNKLTIEIVSFEQDDTCGLQPSYFVTNE